MKSLSHKPLTRLLSFSSSRLLLRISLYSTTSNSSPYSTALYSSSSFPSRRHDDESRNVKVSVWWDFENCSIPNGANVYKVAHSITTAVRACGIKGPIQITAFGDVFVMPRQHQEGLSSTGVNLTHIPRGGKNSADRSLLLDLMCWVSQNPPPAHLFLISGDRDFAGILHRLRMSNYNILLASLEGPPVLCSAASVMWQWTELVKGENLTGRHFNQPPDGPYNSWYGHYRGSLEDPYAVSKKPRSSRADNSSDDEVLSDGKIHQIPKAVKESIRRILNSHPQGIPSTVLRESLKELVKLDKDYYGHKKFSQFLLSMPDILKVEYMNDGVYMLHAVHHKVPESVVSHAGTSGGSMIKGENQESSITSDVGTSPGSMVKDENQESSITSDTDYEVHSANKLVKSKSPLSSAPDANKNEEGVGKVLERKPKIVPVPEAHESTTKETHGKERLDVDVTDGHVDISREKDSATQMGFFQDIWSKWFRHNDTDSERKIHAIPDIAHSTSDSTGKADSEVTMKKIHAIPYKKHASSDGIGNSDSEGRNHESSAQHGVSDPIHFPSSQPERDLDTKGEINSAEPDDKPNDHPGFFSKVMSWCKNAFTGQRSEELGSITNPIEFELFSKDSLWAEMEAFIKTQKGLDIILSSRSRDQIGENLQKDGPVLLRSLKQTDLLHLVDSLISEKKWIQECPSESPPFRVLLTTDTTSASSRPHNLNGLRSIFMNKPPHADMKHLPEEDSEGKNTNLPRAGASSTVYKKPSLESRQNVMADCQNLVESLLKENPEGLNIGRIKQAFHERYGYVLDYQNMGYAKLVQLLAKMPGVKIEPNYIFPANTLVQKHQSTEVDQRKDKRIESPWEELGPVATSELRKFKAGTGSCSSRMEDNDNGYESAVSEDDGMSDAEEEAVAAEPRAENEVDSSLLRVLDSWYSNKEEFEKKDVSDSDHGMSDDPKETQKQPSRPSLASVAADSSAAANARKQKRGKTITFVSNADGENKKDNLIDGILSSLSTVKKSGKSTVEG